MSEVEIPVYVREAEAQRQLYQSHERFLKARAFVKDLLENEAGSTLDQLVFGFLRDRKIKPDATAQQLAKIKEEEVRLLGAAFYFGRRFFTTSHDIGDGLDPNSLVQNVFDALKASDNHHSKRFLEEIAGISNKDPYTQEKVVAVVREVLPELTKNYDKSLAVISLKHPIGSSIYKIDKATLDADHMKLLDGAVAYIKEVIHRHEEPTLEGFKKYAGLNENNEGKKSREITVGYIEELLKKYGRDYDTLIRELERDAGQLVNVTNHRDRDGNELKLCFYVGDPKTPRPNQIVYTGRNSSMRGLLMRICDNIQTNPEIPPELKTSAAIARKGIDSYFLRG